MRSNTLGSLGFGLAALAWFAQAQDRVLYRLSSESTLEADFCLDPCACPLGTLTGQAAGWFSLTLENRGPLFDHYRITNFHLIGDIGDLLPITLNGGGAYRIGGEVGVMHEMRLAMQYFDTPVPFDSGLVLAELEHPFPEIAITVPSEIVGCLQFDVRIIAAPVDCPSDLNGDGVVGLEDLAQLLHNFGAAGGVTHDDGDINGDQTVDLSDLALLLADFGTNCLR